MERDYDGHVGPRLTRGIKRQAPKFEQSSLPRELPGAVQNSKIRIWSIVAPAEGHSNGIQKFGVATVRIIIVAEKQRSICCLCDLSKHQARKYDIACVAEYVGVSTAYE